MEKINREKIKGLVEKGISLDKSIAIDKKELDKVKARLQSIAFEDMDNKNIKYKEIFGETGKFNASYKEKFEIDNYNALGEILGDIAADKISRTEKVSYTVNARLKNALTSLYNDDYKKGSIDEVLDELDSKQLKIVKKKLKGDYFKDKALLQSYGYKGDLEEELDEIRQIKNYELIERFGLADIDKQTLKKCIFIEETLAVGFEYEKE